MSTTEYDAIFLVASMCIQKRHIDYASMERLKQTNCTLESIRKKIPNSFIIVIDGSKDYDSMVSHVSLNHRADIVLHAGIYNNCQEFCDNTNSTTIGRSEQKLLELGRNYILDNNIVGKLVLKIGLDNTESVYKSKFE